MKLCLIIYWYIILMYQYIIYIHSLVVISIMTVEDRIKLRDELREQFKSKNLLITSNGTLRISNMKRINNELSSNEELSNKYQIYKSQFKSEKEALYCLSHITDSSEHLCKICGNVLLFYDRGNHYRKTCGSDECKKACIISDEAKEHRKQTNIDRYGTENPFSSEIIKEKIKKTNVERYGVDNPSKCDSVKEKIKKTMLDNYGVEYAMQSEEIRNKAYQTMNDKYGSEHALQVKEFQDKAKQTTIQRFGVENAAESDVVKENIRTTMNDKYGVNVSTQLHITNYDIWSNDEKFKNLIIEKYNEKKSFLVLNDVSSFFNVDPNTIRYRINKLGLTEYFYIQDSNLEIEFETFLKSNNIRYERHYRKIRTADTNQVKNCN